MLVRYCDDLVVMCATRQQAEAALEQLTELLAGLGLEPKAAKTRIVHLTGDKDAEGFDFLGFHHWLVRGRTPKSAHLTFLARWLSRKAAQHARDRIREITARERLLVPAEGIVEDLNRFLRGWAGYSRYGNSALMLGQIRNYALSRLALWHPIFGRRLALANRVDLGVGLVLGVRSAGYSVRPLRMTVPARAPFLFGDWIVISIVEKSRGSAALVMEKVLLPLSGKRNVPADATCPSRLTYQHPYHGSGSKCLRWRTAKVTSQLPEASWRAVACPVADPYPLALPAAVT